MPASSGWQERSGVMTTKQGSLALLDSEVAQRLLRSTAPAQLAYSWTDGSPRVIPIGFHWTGSELFFGTQPDAPKMRSLHDGAQVAVSIDMGQMPYEALLLRGRVRTDTVQGLAPEYEVQMRRMLGQEQGQAWLDQLRGFTPSMSRIFVTPEWVAVLDFQTRFP